MEETSSEQRDSFGDLRVKPESLQQRRLRVAEMAVRVAKSELRQLDVYSTSDVVLERAQLAVERAKLEAETIRAESPEITYLAVQDPEAAVAALKEQTTKLSDPRCEAKANWRRYGGF
ncbi:hypothetical protein [Prescottella equi]|uniref:hypothetical protein n=1 Tax=Rhodococcus hoagii TaxID=43767 RepID=UPI001EEC3AD6|nr:hypothetical protein [Prescottella equi]